MQRFYRFVTSSSSAGDLGTSHQTVVQSAKLVEARLPLASSAKPKSLPPIRRCAMLPFQTRLILAPRPLRPTISSRTSSDVLGAVTSQEWLKFG
jgi:hypothetical protein